MKPEQAIFEDAVSAHYQSVYRFAFSLTRSEADACDLTQTAFERLLRNAAQVRDASKLKTWLFTTLYRAFLEQRRHETRFPKVAVDEATLPVVESGAGDSIDGASVSNALAEIEEPFRSTLILFYLQEHSYREIAEILNVPVGTVMSRLSRGKALLRALLANRTPNIVPLPLKAAS